MESFDNDYMPHQRQCLEAIRGEYSKKSPIISFKLCTGSGKTRIILRIPSLCQTKRNVFIFPTIALIDQFKKDYLDEFTQFFKNWHEVSTNGISDRKLKKILAQKEFCIVTTYLSLPKVLSESKYIDALIFDEAHHVGAPGCDNAIAENISKIGCQFRASATPKDDEDNCFTYSFAQAVKDRRCRDYNIYSFIKKIGNEHELSQYLLDHLVKTGNGRVMAFTRWTEADREDSTSVHKFYDAYYRSITDCGGWIRKITAETSSQERTAILTEFDAIPDGRLALLVSCKTINEGVDSRNANVAFFVDTDKSTVTIIQRIGRATRPYRLNGQLIDDQRPGTVMVGMYISIEKYEGKTPEQIDELLKQEMSENGDFGPIFRVLAALKQSDPETYQRCIHYPHFQKLQQKVETETSYELYDVPRDGNCFFHCLALHTDSDADELRQDVCDHLEENLDKYEEFGIDEEDVELLREDGEWCSGVMDVAVKAAADMLGKRISVHRPDGQVDTVGDDDCKEGDKINVLLDGNHYSVLLEKGIEKDTPKIKKFRDEEKDEKEKKKKRGGKIMLDIDPSFKILFGLNKSASLVEDFTARIDISIEDDGKTLEERALEKANEYVDWFKENGRRPSCVLRSSKEQKKNATEDQIKEHSLAAWFSRIKGIKNYRSTCKLYPSVENLFIKTFGEEWSENRDLETLSLKKANEYIEWFKKNGRHPRDSNKQTTEHSLNTWFTNIRRRKILNKIYPSVEKLLIETFGEEWYENRDLEKLSLEKANEYIEWFKENGRSPLLCLAGKNKTGDKKTEHYLAQWFSSMKKTKNNPSRRQSKLYPSVEKLLIETFGEEWYENRESLSLEKANEYVEWFKENGRHPSSVLKSKEKKENATDNQKIENELSTWFNSVKYIKNNPSTKRGKLYPSVEKLLIETFDEEWYENRDLEKLSLEKANEYIEWFKENRRHASQCLISKEKKENATDNQKIESECAQWYRHIKEVKQEKKSSMKLYPSVEKLLIETFGEEWYENRDLESLSLEKANEYVEWFKENGRHPSSVLKSKEKQENATDNQKIESECAQWYRHMKKAGQGKGHMKLYPSVEKLLVETFGENWFANRDLETLALENVQEYVVWFKDNGRHPLRCLNSKEKRENTIDEKKKEHRLSQWFDNTKMCKKGFLNNRTLYPSVENLLIKTFGEKWYETKQEIKECPHVKTSGKNKGQICGKRLQNGKERCAEHSGKKSPSVSSVSSETSVSTLDDKVKKKPTTFTPSKSKTTESNGIKQAPVYSRHSMILKEYKVMHSRTLANRFHENRKEWHDYHALAEENERGFGEDVPYRRIIAYLEKTLPPRKKKTVVDMGCGLARVAKAFSGRKNIDFINIDHVACDESVMEGDISHTGLGDGEADVAVLCLAMWGSNKEEYIKEAYRILDTQGGRLLIIEPVKKWLREDGSHSLRDLLVSTGFTIRVEEVKMGEDNDKYHKFSMFVAEK